MLRRAETRIIFQKRGGETVEMLVWVADARHGDAIVRGGHLGFDAVPLPQRPRERGAGEVRRTAGEEHELPGVEAEEGRMVPGRVVSRAQDAQAPERFHFFAEGRKAGLIGGKKRRAVFFEKPQACVDGGEEHVGRAAGLEGIHRPPERGFVHESAPEVQQRALCEGGEGLVQAHDRQIRAGADGVFPEGRGKAEMRAVRRVHEEGDACLMRRFGDAAEVAFDPRVGGRGNDDEPGVGFAASAARTDDGETLPAMPVAPSTGSGR
jgi:hypothetical protein